jgi:hypothetical protein
MPMEVNSKSIPSSDNQFQDFSLSYHHLERSMYLSVTDEKSNHASGFMSCIFSFKIGIWHCF